MLNRIPYLLHSAARDLKIKINKMHFKILYHKLKTTNSQDSLKAYNMAEITPQEICAITIPCLTDKETEAQKGYIIFSTLYGVA
jgi:hypothetical protein